jgi:DNA segregation ATPase FtsK/SpoIIIE, S-DNA-T family
VGLEKAVDLIIEHRIASASFFQRRMCIGYNCALALIEKLEDNGIIGPLIGSRQRKVLQSNKEL